MRYYLVAALGLGAVGLAITATARSGDPPLAPSVRIDRLVVYKAERRMEAYAGKSLVRTYEITIGAAGAGPKRFEGDRRTPEGDYAIDSRHPSRTNHRFLHVSYPNATDRARFQVLVRQGEVPDGRGIGGAIGIHGEPPLASLVPDSLVPEILAPVTGTAGCIAVSNEEAEELFEHVVPDAPITIHP